MPRLLIFCEYPTLLGGERSMLATLPAVDAAGFTIHVAAPPKGPLADSLRQRGVSHLAWSTRETRGQRLPLDALRAEAANLIRTVRPALIHANSLASARLVGPVARSSGLKSLGHLRDIIKLGPQAIDDLNAHTRLLAVSRATRDFHVAQGIDPKRTYVVNNGVDLDEFRPRPPAGYLHRELNLPPAARLIVVIGQLGLRKGTDVALAAALQVAADVPDTHWLVVGERTSAKQESHDFEALLHSLADEPPLAGRVHFLGSRTDVPRLLNECVLLVHAARQEPLGRVLLEAAATGLAIMATDVGGTAEIFPIEMQCACLVPPDNRLAMAGAVLDLMRHDARRQMLATCARRRAEAAFDIRSTAAKLIGQYQLTLT